MTREHTPRPGVTWEQQLKQIEQQLGTPVTNDDYRRIQPLDEVSDTEPPPEPEAPEGKPLLLPGANRAARRAAAREARRRR